jgi:hypothetical protein
MMLNTELLFSFGRLVEVYQIPTGTGYFIK